jgi:CheY-like chemotaxis protein
MRILFLDDSEERIEQAKEIYSGAELVIVRTAPEAIQQLFHGPWDVVSLDHDLGGEVLVDSDREDCGMEVVRWIIKNKPPLKIITIHSWNIPAGKRMAEDLQKAGYYAHIHPFGSGASLWQAN